MSPYTAFAVTLTSLPLAFLLEPTERGIYCGAAVIAYSSIARSARGALTFAFWALAFGVPLVLVHGVLNPAFQATSSLWGSIPIRPGGLEFGLAQGSRILCLFAPALYWLAVDRRDFIRLVSRFRLNRMLAVAAFEAVALTREIDVRARVILEAQKARGIRTEGMPWIRARALIAVLVPLTTTLLRDAPVRARIQSYLGTADAAFACSDSAPLGSTREARILLVCFTSAALVPVGLHYLQGGYG